MRTCLDFQWQYRNNWKWNEWKWKCRSNQIVILWLPSKRWRWRRGSWTASMRQCIVALCTETVACSHYLRRVILFMNPINDITFFAACASSLVGFICLRLTLALCKQIWFFFFRLFLFFVKLCRLTNERWNWRLRKRDEHDSVDECRVDRFEDAAIWFDCSISGIKLRVFLSSPFGAHDFVLIVHILLLFSGDYSYNSIE